MCDVLKVSRSGFYAWRHRKDAPPTPNELKRQQRTAVIEEAFKDSHSIYGYRKIHATLRHGSKTECKEGSNLNRESRTNGDA
jgi:hypothetical protein